MAKACRAVGSAEEFFNQVIDVDEASERAGIAAARMPMAIAGFVIALA
jgi:hypothetical protein